MDTTPQTQPKQSTHVTLTDIDLPFWSMAIFMIKWAIAAIPALLVFTIIFYALVGVLGILAGIRHR